MITYELCNTDLCLQQILDLQKVNLEVHISEDELRNEGFVTVHHDFNLLAKICGNYGHMIAKDNGQVIAYALVMLKQYGSSIPVLVPMFDKINTLSYKGSAVQDTNYLVMGQVCVDKSYRGKGVFRDLYFGMQSLLAKEFDYLITEVATRNTRSIRAHAKVGFECINSYHADGEDWDILLWDWSK